MEYPVVAVDKKGRGILLLDSMSAINIAHEDGMIQFVDEIPKDLKPLKFPVKAFANHLLAATCNHLYETAVIKELSKHVDSFLMPGYMTKEVCQKCLDLEARPVALESFLPYWAPLVQENIDMATKKPAAKAKAKPAAKAAKAAPKTAKAEGTKKRGIGAFCKELIAKGKTNDEILEAVAKEFPDAGTTKGSIAFYRNAVKAGK